MPGVTVTISNEATGLSRTEVTGPEGRFVVAGLRQASMTYVPKSQASSRTPPRGRLAVADNVAVAIVLEVGDARDRRRRCRQTAHRQHVELRAQLPGASETIETLPLNGRNYTDLALLQPGVIAYPHRDGGSVVAHGLGMSVNGQDPRVERLPARRHAAERLHQRPGRQRGGHRAGHGDRARVPRRDQCLQRGVRPHRGRADQCPDEVGQQPFTGSAVRIPPQRCSRRGELLRHAAASQTSRATSLAARSVARSGPNRSFFFVGYEALVERLGRTISTVVPDDNARLGILPTGAVGVNPAVAPYLDEFPRANGPSLGQGLAVYDFPFDQTLDQHFVQGRVDYNQRRHAPVVRALHVRRREPVPADRLPAVPARSSCRATSSSPANTGRCFSTHAQYGAPGFSRTRIGQNVEANTSQPLAPFVPGRDSDGRHRHRRHQALRAAELRQPAARAERVQLPGRPLATRAAGIS